MANGKYEHLIKPLSMAAMPGVERTFKNTGNADSNYWLNGRDHLEGLPLNFSWGFYTGLGDWHPGMDPHVHPYPECLVFVGLDPNNVEYLGAEIEYCLGEELEVHRFDRPTVVIVPAGVPHCPSVTRNVTNPIGYSFFIISLGAIPRTTWMGAGVTEERMRQMQERQADPGNKMPMESTFSEQKIKASEETLTYGHRYDHLVKPLKPMTSSPEGTAENEVRPGPGNTDSLIWMQGRDLEGLNMSFTWAFYKSPGIWHRGPGNSDGTHIHPSDEVLVFVGTDPGDINYLGAEISIDMGDDRERYVFDKPTAVICPKGLKHNPVIARWVDRPYACYRIGLSGEYQADYED